MNGWMGLICFLAYMWIMCRSTTGHTFEQGEMWVLGVIMAVVSVWLLAAWAGEAHRAYDEYRRSQS